MNVFNKKNQWKYKKQFLFKKVIVFLDTNSLKNWNNIQITQLMFVWYKWTNQRTYSRLWEMKNKNILLHIFRALEQKAKFNGINDK